jgi:cytochrome c oxidase assembly protein subunit 15
LGAIVTFLLLLFVAISFIRRDPGPDPATIRRAGQLVILALVAQVSIGVGIVWFGLPLFLASAHNGVAALLLLSVINLNHATSLYTEPA